MADEDGRHGGPDGHALAAVDRLNQRIAIECEVPSVREARWTLHHSAFSFRSDRGWGYASADAGKMTDSIVSTSQQFLSPIRGADLGARQGLFDCKVNAGLHVTG